MSGFLRFFLEQKVIVVLFLLFLVGWGLAVAPFNWDLGRLPRDPVPVDAIPNLGENQQIVFTEWPGRSPRDMEDQVTYPLTVSLLGVPGVREVRSQSMFGSSSIFLIFEDDIEFYWARSRIMEKLNSLGVDTLPSGVRPSLGPDATGLGQIFWYTLEGRDPQGRPVSGWDLQELRSVQDWYVRYGLKSAEGVSEVASIGGFVAEYLVEIDPDLLRIHDVTLAQVLAAARESNLEVGARTTEINRVEYFIRGAGFIKDIEELEKAVVRLAPGNTPVRIRDVATVTRGPGERRGALTIGGAEAVGGVIAVREGFNPMQALANIHDKIAELRPGMPSKPVIFWENTTADEVRAFAAQADLPTPGVDGAPNPDRWRAWMEGRDSSQWPHWLTLSTLSIEPFYDRTALIRETLGTLNDALVQQVLVTMIVVMVLLFHLRAALLVSALLPFSVLAAFILMKLTGVDANVVALAGIAIAIGTIVDMGIILTENLMRRLREADPEEPRLELVYRSAREVGPAILTAISTTVVSFLPVFTMTGAEGKLFVPLAYTKTFVLVASIALTLVALPAALHFVVARRWSPQAALVGLALLGIAGFGVGVAAGWSLLWLVSLLLFVVALARLSPLEGWLRPRWGGLAKAASWGAARRLPVAVAGLAICWVLAVVWEPLGPERGRVSNFVFLLILIGGLLGLFLIFSVFYERLLRWALAHKVLYLLVPTLVVLLGAVSWLGFDRVFRFVPATVSLVGGKEEWVTHSRPWVWAVHEFRGLGREFMPALDEGAFLWMPTTMPHASLGEALEVLSYQDQAIAAVPEVEWVAGKIGRAETALDPAPVSMIETVIQYKPEYRTDEDGRRLSFRYDRRRGEFVRDADGELIPDRRGRAYRQWREHIRTPADIWTEIAEAAHLPGTTSAPRLQPIETRLVMLQSGMRAPWV